MGDRRWHAAQVWWPPPIALGRAARCFALAMIGALAVSGCVSRGNELGTTASPCFAGLAAAAKAASSHAALVGVRIEPAPMLSVLPHIELKLSTRSGSVCLYAFHRGHDSGFVRSLGPASGAYMVVAVYPGSSTVLVERRVSHLPLDFGHDGIGDR